MIVVVFKYLTPKGFQGITVFPFVIVKSKAAKQNPTLIQHERIHLRQQIEMGVLPFFIWYSLEFFWHYFQGSSRQLAYRLISFEQEAYQNEHNLDYLAKRPFWHFVAYFTKKKLPS